MIHPKWFCRAGRDLTGQLIEDVANAIGDDRSLHGTFQDGTIRTATTRAKVSLGLGGLSFGFYRMTGSQCQGKRSFILEEGHNTQLYL